MIDNKMKNSKVLKGLTDAEMCRLLEGSFEIDVEIGQTIIRKDMIENNIYILKEGSARLLANDEKGDLVTVGHCHAGEILGIIDLLRQRPTECAIAREQSKLLVIQVNKVLELLECSEI